MSWVNKRKNSLTGPDGATLRAIFHDLEEFLKNPTFEQGINVGAADAVRTVDVATGVFTPPPTTSTSGAWTAYTPTNTAITLGNGTQVARHMLDGKTCTIRHSFVLGTTSAIGAGAEVGLPFAAHADGYQGLQVSFEEGGVASQVGAARIAPGGSKAILIHDEGTGGGATTSAIPFTWGSTDKIIVSGAYEIA